MALWEIKTQINLPQLAYQPFANRLGLGHEIGDALYVFYIHIGGDFKSAFS